MSTLTLRPDSDVDLSSGGFVDQAGGTTNLYLSIDEESPDDDTTYIVETSGTATGHFGLPDHGAVTGVITNVRLVYRGKKSGFLFTAAVCGGIKVGASDSNHADSLRYPTSYTNYTMDWVESPLSGVTWSWAEIDLLQIYLSGYCVGGTYARLTQAYIEVTYHDPTDAVSFSEVPCHDLAVI